MPGTYVIKVRHLKPTKADSYTVRISYAGPTPKPWSIDAGASVGRSVSIAGAVEQGLWPILD